jgi:hypothetical protein
MISDQSLLASVRTSNPPFAYSVANAAPSGGIGQYQTHHAESTGALNHASSPHHFTTVPPLYHPPTGAFYGAQHRASPAMTFADQHQSPYLVAEGSHKVASSADEVCPVPIPLPNEVAQGQSLTLNAFNAVELSNSAVIATFALLISVRLILSLHIYLGSSVHKDCFAWEST